MVSIRPEPTGRGAGRLPRWHLLLGLLLGAGGGGWLACSQSPDGLGPEECREDLDCPGPLVCIQGAAGATGHCGCAQTEQCPGSQTCSLTTSVCSCRTDGDCPAGQACLARRCVCRTAAECPGCARCNAGRCEQGTGEHTRLCLAGGGPGPADAGVDGGLPADSGADGGLPTPDLGPPEVPFRNRCGGTQRLPDEQVSGDLCPCNPGAPCCGRFQCVGPDELRCTAPVVGEAEDFRAILGDSCDGCGTWRCTAAGQAACQVTFPGPDGLPEVRRVGEYWVEPQAGRDVCRQVVCRSCPLGDATCSPFELRDGTEECGGCRPAPVREGEPCACGQGTWQCRTEGGHPVLDETGMAQLFCGYQDNPCGGCGAVQGLPPDQQLGDPCGGPCWGQWGCLSHDLVACLGSRERTEEVCNGVDDDCDQEIDDGFDPLTDPDHCGGCGRACAFAHATARCEAGQCVLGDEDCEPGFKDLNQRAEDGCECPVIVEICNGQDDDCDGVIDNGFDLANNSEHCGRCNHPCQAPEICRQGVCRNCAGPEVCNYRDDNCDGDTDEGFVLETDPEHCGECNRRCSLPHAQARCGNGQCLLGDCDPGYSNRNEEPADGCECQIEQERCNNRDDDCDGQIDEGFELANDPHNCGECGYPCDAGEACVDGTCQPPEPEDAP